MQQRSIRRLEQLLQESRFETSRKEKELSEIKTRAMQSNTMAATAAGEEAAMIGLVLSDKLVRSAGRVAD
jgi:hypothetical protein